jgi:hypothetical protein
MVRKLLPTCCTMKVNELKGALLKRFAGEMETANGNNDNNLATSPLIHSDDVPEMQTTRVIDFFTLDELTVIVLLCVLLTVVSDL